MHNATTEMEAMARKGNIQRFIENHLELEEEGLNERDHYLLGINLEDLGITAGEEQHYWLH